MRERLTPGHTILDHTMSAPDDGAGQRGAHAAIVGLMVLIAGCTPAIHAPAVSPDACVVLDELARPRVTVGAAAGASPLDSPVTAASQLVFAQLHETLVSSDCTGRLTAGLASEWSSTDGRTWRFTIAPGATFGDGTPVTAQTIIGAWSSADVRDVAQASAAGAHDLRVTLRDSADAHVFARPAFAVGRRTGGAPVGTGAYILDVNAPSRTIRLLARTPDPHTPDTIDFITFTGDPRAALDAGVDVLVSADPSTIEYARARSDYSIAPLPWARTIVLATRSTGESAPDQVMQLARDAVRVDARPAAAPFWWQHCMPASVAQPAPADELNILYPRADGTARSVAERITALAWPHGRTPEWLGERLGRYDSPPRATAAPGVSRADAVLAVVASLARTGAGCSELDQSIRAGTSIIPRGWWITPLFDTRAYLIHRSGAGRVTVDAAGTIRFGTQ